MQDKQDRIDASAHSSSLGSSQSASSLEGREVLPPIANRYQRQIVVYLSELVEERAYIVVRLVGYSLLLFSIFDYVYIVTPPQFTNPIWEFQTIGALVEHVATPLLGLMLIFYRRQGYIVELERKLLGFLSWLCLLLGLLYLLMLPLGIVNTWRIHHLNLATVSTQVSQQNQPFQDLKSKLNRAHTDDQIKQLLTSLAPKNRAPQIKNPQEIKDQILGRISQAQQKIQVQAEAVGVNNRNLLMRNSIKWNLGALISGTLLVTIWRLTDWARSNIY